jgi:hypothetical protein
MKDNKVNKNNWLIDGMGLAYISPSTAQRGAE